MSDPRGIRLANPLNIKHSSARWKGLAANQPDPTFAAFEAPVYGIRAAAKNLLTYGRRDGLKTVRGIVTKWAPPTDHNDTESYIATVSRALGVGSDEAIDLEKPAILRGLLTAMMKVEVGTVPYDVSIVEAGVAMAYDTPAGEVRKTAPVDQPTPAPTAKVTAAAVGGGVGFIVAFCLIALWNRLMPEAPLSGDTAATLGSAISTGLALVCAYMKRDHGLVVEAPCDPEVPPP